MERDDHTVPTKGYGADDKHYSDFVSALPSQVGKVCVITGTTSGTGYYWSLAAAKKGATVVMLNRASNRATSSAADLRAECPEGTFDDSIECDLMSFASVRTAAAAIVEKYGVSGVNVLCCNAGIMAFADEATTDGFDVQMQTNHLSHFLLVSLLMPLLDTAAEKCGEARIVNHSSIARQGVKLEAKYMERNGGNLGGDSSSMFLGGARWVRYSHTKMANCVFTHALKKRLDAKGSKVRALTAAPGLATTNLQVTTLGKGGMSDSSCCCGGNFWIMKMAQSSGDGAMGIIHCAFNADAKSGEFWEPPGTGLAGVPALRAPVLKLESNEEIGDMLWKCSLEATGVSNFL
jgi:NAD(P)-dependent dehydrogenase (short-subunit alcohol dehydrogenase family)